MIYIEKGTINEIGLTLSETSQVVDPIYWFEFVRNINSNPEKYYFTAPDISTAKNRLNVFEFVEGEGGMELPSGEYTYNVYELQNPEPGNNQTIYSSENIDIVGMTTGTIIETGRLNVGMSFEEDDQNNDNTDPYGNI